MQNAKKKHFFKNAITKLKFKFVNDATFKRDCNKNNSKSKTGFNIWSCHQRMIHKAQFESPKQKRKIKLEMRTYYLRKLK